MNHPSLKPDDSILFKSSSFRTVKYNNFVLLNVLCITVFLKTAIVIQKKDREKKTCIWVQILCKRRIFKNMLKTLKLWMKEYVIGD
jgi:hypothetical protein